MKFRLAVVSGACLCGGMLHAQFPTTTTLTSVTPTAPLFGEPVTLTAQVVGAFSLGTVFFMDGGVLVGVGTLNASGIAQITTISLSAGLHRLQVVYGGIRPYQPSQSAVLPYIVTAVSGAGFATGVHYPTEDGHTVAVGDFNGDGKADLAVAKVFGLDANGNHTLDGTGVGQDLAFPFGGLPNDKPMIGKW